MSDRTMKPLWSAVAQKAGPPSPPTQRKASTSSQNPEPNGHSPPGKGIHRFELTSIRNKFRWADDVDDDLNTAVDTSLTATIKKLEAVVADRDAEIAQLKEKLLQIKKLQADVAERDAEIVRLKGELVLIKSSAAQEIQKAEEKHSKLLELYDEKTKLYDEKSKQYAALQEETSDLHDDILALQSKLSKTRPNTLGVESEMKKAAIVSPKKNSTDTMEPAVLPTENDKANEPSPAVPSVDDGDSVSNVSSTKVESHISSERPLDSSMSSTEFPALSSKTVANPWPIFATPDTIKAASPVPPPKKLKMGIDTSKFGKKDANVPRKMNTGASSVDQKIAKPVPVPAITPGKDIRTMSPEQRSKLGHGPKVTIKLGSETIGIVAMAMFKQCSHLANDYITQNPETNTISFKAGIMTSKAARAHIDWMNQHTFNKKVWSISLNTNATDREKLDIVRAARVMGIDNMYVGHFTRHFCDTIRGGKPPSFELMALIEELAFHENDPIVECLAGNIVIRRHFNSIPNPAALDKFLSEHPVLAKKVEKAREKAREKSLEKAQQYKNGGGRKGQTGGAPMRRIPATRT